MRAQRFAVSFSVSIMWQEKSGATRRIVGRCLDLSAEGMKLEARDRLDVGTSVLVSCMEFGRMGHAIVRYCQRDRMRCLLGIKFSSAFGLSDPARRKILERVLRPEAATADVDAGAGIE